MTPNYGDMMDEDRMRCVSVLHTIAANVLNKGLSDIAFRDFVESSLNTVPSAIGVMAKHKSHHDLLEDSDKGLYVSCDSLHGDSVFVSYTTLRHCLKPLAYTRLKAAEKFTPEQYTDMFLHVCENTSGPLVEASQQFLFICGQSVLNGQDLNFSLLK